MKRSPLWLALLLAVNLNTMAFAAEGDEAVEEPAAEAEAPAEEAAAPVEGEAPAEEADAEPPAESDPQARKDALKYWEDYIHYLRVAQLELANAAGQALLGLEVSDADLLLVVDELAPYRDYERSLVTAQKMEALEGKVAELSFRVEKRIQDARLNLAREGSRVRRSIESLDDGLRARLNALTRLKKAGEYAAPHLLAVLLSNQDEDRALRPYAIEALVEIGRPVVVPLCEALEYLPPVPKQQVAMVLSRIGYPVALPYLKAQVIEGSLDADTRGVLETAFDGIIERSNVPAPTDAATLFLMLGEDYYNNREALVLEPKQEFNLLWDYDAAVGLVFKEVPTPVFHDAMAMRAAKRSLKVNPEYAAALSLWIAANCRRENNLGEKADPSYAPTMESPHFYATLAGPTHVQPVLFRALSDNDSELALDAIRAMAATATTAERIGQDIQPLIAAMSYSDRRVRFESAMALGRSLPRVEFSGAQRVVPVLAEAIRETAKPYALVLAPNLDAISRTSTLLSEDLGFSTIFGDTFETAHDQIASVPGVDLIVISLPTPQAEAAVNTARTTPKLQGTPIVVLAPADEVPTVTQIFSEHKNIVVTSVVAEAAEITSAVEQAVGSAKGAVIDEAQALLYATGSLDLLLDLTKEAGAAFRAADAQPALISALADKRDPVVLGSAKVLARFNDGAAQQAVADAALDGNREEAMRIQLLRTLADSGNIHGNLLTDGEIQLLLKLVKESDGELADAAAEAHGALDLPTSDAVELIVQ